MLHSPEVVALPTAVRASLAAQKPGAYFSEVQLKDDCPPAVLMVTDNAVHAFIVGTEQEYDALYDAFKKYFMSRGAEWTSMDVSFVYCLPSGYEADERFHSRVEVDVYFCRKYVVQLGPSIETAFSRLPFLPLAPVSGKNIRPPTAKNLLRQRNVKVDLANALIEPGTSPQTLLENCLAGKYGITHEINRSAELSTEVASDKHLQATLKSIEIKNFRAYRKTKEFKLGSAVTVLYGPNGFGKTSFFDAVDFVVTGGVGRLDRPSGGLHKVVKHLDSKDEPTHVSLTFERGGNTHVITRDLTSPNDATLDGKAASRKVILNSLTGSASGAADHVENLVALFRATHLFSQDRQELTREVANKCTLQASIVSRMLAFDDYVNGLKKVNDVIKLAKQERARAAVDTETSSKEIDNDAAEVARLEQLHAAGTAPDILSASFDELEKSLSVGGIDLNGADVRDTRSLRALLEKTAGEARSRQNVLEQCLEHVRNIALQSVHLVPLKAHANEAKTRFESAEGAVRASGQMLAVAAAEAAKAKSEEHEHRTRRDWLRWAVAVQPENANLLNEEKKHTENLSELAKLLVEQREKLSQAEVAYDEAQASLTAAESKFAAGLTEGEDLQKAEATFSIATETSASIAVLKSAETKLRSELEVVRSQTSASTQDVIEQDAIIAHLETQLSVARNHSDRLRSLIAELRSHVRGSDCLLCGHVHSSPEALMAAIEGRMGQVDLVASLNETLSAEQEKKRTLEQQNVARRNTFQEIERQLNVTQQEIAKLERQVVDFKHDLAAIGLALGTESSKSSLAEMRAKNQESINQARINLASIKESFSAKHNEAVAARLAYATAEKEKQAISALLNDIRKKAEEILKEAQRGGVNIELATSVLNQLLHEQEVLLTSSAEKLNVANMNLDVQRAAQEAAVSQASVAAASHQAALRAFTTAERNVQSRVVALSAAGVNAESKEEELEGQIAVAQKSEATAVALINRAAELEVATDASATSAAFQSIRARIVENEQIQRSAESRIKLLDPWIRYFENISKLLSGQQAKATEHFTSGYGPRTEMIQRRLRPVYGFNDIAVTSKDSSIQINIRRNGEDLLPTDYFSQSQVQTLVLGLFLTACSSQTWSGFSSIMMDDPVTHFDNLNTYALLDLILGLHNSPEGARQFVISTCDEKLLQLARHKFRHLGDSAKFYRFSAIGSEGPLVAEIPA